MASILAAWCNFNCTWFPKMHCGVLSRWPVRIYYLVICTLFSIQVTGYYVMSLLSVFVSMAQMGLYCYTTVYVAQICIDFDYCPDIAVS